MNKTVQVITLGCSKNNVDTEHLLAQLEENYKIVPESIVPDFVDYLLINTCGFIGDAKEESINVILEAAARKGEGAVGQLMVFGCLSQRYAAELPELIPEVDAWFGARDLRPIVKALGVKYDKSKETVRYQEKHRGYAYLKISEGCDRRCSYCAIPHIRGAHKSVPMEQVVQEAEALAARGIKELVVIAQDTTYYGLDLYHRRALAELLERLAAIESIEWIRIHYSYPDNFPEDVLDVMANNPKICKYLDIPLQHISDGVLKKMRRNVDGATTRRTLENVRNKVAGVVVRTTMIVGHPGESGADFDELLDFVETVGFERLGAFTYSEEEGTYGAIHYEDEVPQEIKNERYAKLMQLQSGISLEFNRSRVGSVEKVMVDDYLDGVYVCRSQYESPEVDGEILLKSEKALRIGDFVNVRIVGADEYDLVAELV